MSGVAVAERRRRYLTRFYGNWITAERADGLYARWLADEAAGAPPSPLCRACGVLLRDPVPGAQLHPTCRIT